jgi:hypothetical protein
MAAWYVRKLYQAAHAAALHGDSVERAVLHAVSGSGMEADLKEGKMRELNAALDRAERAEKALAKCRKSIACRVSASTISIINDKHIEVVVHQMLSKVRIDTSGDTELVAGELVDRFRYEEVNAKVLAEGGEPATAHTVLLGITRASLNTESGWRQPHSRRQPGCSPKPQSTVR